MLEVAHQTAAPRPYTARLDRCLSAAQSSRVSLGRTAKMGTVLLQQLELTCNGRHVGQLHANGVACINSNCGSRKRVAVAYTAVVNSSCTAQVHRQPRCAASRFSSNSSFSRSIDTDEVRRRWHSYKTNPDAQNKTSRQLLGLYRNANHSTARKHPSEQPETIMAQGALMSVDLADFTWHGPGDAARHNAAQCRHDI